MTKVKTGSWQKASKAKRKHKFPCIVCEKNCNVNQQSIYYAQCLSWVHRKCNGTCKADSDELRPGSLTKIVILVLNGNASLNSV